jgi:hypothetical protein
MKKSKSVRRSKTKKEKVWGASESPAQNIKELKTKVISGRLTERSLEQLHRLYPGQSDSQIVSNLVEEKVARLAFDKWIEEMKKGFRPEDFDFESL